MRIVRNCQDRALLLLQIAGENPEFKDQADFLAREWLGVAAMRIRLGLIERHEKEPRAN